MIYWTLALKYYLLASILSGKWCDLTWPRKGPKFNLHHLREISMVFKMAVVTPNMGIFYIMTMTVRFLVL